MPPRKDGLPIRRPRPCMVCKHGERLRIEALQAGGATLDNLSAQFGVSRDALHRHWHQHVADETKANLLLGKAKIEKLAELAADENRSVIEYLGIMRSLLFSQMERLARKDDHAGVAAIASRLTRVLAQLAQVTGQASEFAAKTSISVTNNYALTSTPAFNELQRELLRLCNRHPQIRQDVVEMLRRIDRQYAPAAPAEPMREVNPRPAITCEAANG
jgi:hypothetical protein